MKTITITISFDEEKITALRLYLEQKGLTIESEITTSLEALYTKTVPTNVRDFINLRAGISKPTEKKKNSKLPVTTESPQDRSENQ